MWLFFLIELTCPEIVKRNTSSSLRGHLALYALCDHNLCAPAVIPNPEATTVRNAAKRFVYSKLFKSCLL